MLIFNIQWFSSLMGLSFLKKLGAILSKQGLRSFEDQLYFRKTGYKVIKCFLLGAFGLKS